MARINIEDIWFVDPRREALVLKIGSLMADGLALRMWRLAQELWKVKRVVPANLFFSVPHAQEFLDCGLAETTEDGIYIKGSNEHFDWYHLHKEQAALGGKKSALRSRNSKGQLLAKSAKPTQVNPSEVQVESKWIQASSSSSSSSSIENLVAVVPKQGNSTTTTDTIHCSELQEAAFSGKREEYEQLLEKVFAHMNERVPLKIKQVVPRLIVHYQDFEDFKGVVTRIINAPACKSGRYVEVALLREIGMITDPNRLKQN